VVLRSDEIRKRLWGRSPYEALPPQAYAPEANAAVYDAMIGIGRSCLETGWPVVLDAVYIAADRRRQAQALAAETGVRFQGFWLQAEPEVLRRRLAMRRGDASDADERVLEAQLSLDPGPISWTILDAADISIAAQETGRRLSGRAERGG
jgi:predicted kinase